MNIMPDDSCKDASSASMDAPLQHMNMLFQEPCNDKLAGNPLALLTLRPAGALALPAVQKADQSMQEKE
jgi:hypothetical protein